MHIYMHTHMHVYGMCTQSFYQWAESDSVAQKCHVMAHAPLSSLAPSLPPGGCRGVSCVWVQGLSSTAFGTGCFLWCCSESVQVADDSSPASVCCSSAQSQIRCVFFCIFLFFSMAGWLISLCWNLKSFSPRGTLLCGWSSKENCATTSLPLC